MALDPARITAALDADADVVFAYLFGSQATSRATPASDVDVAVYLRANADPFESRLRLMGVLEHALGTDAIDLVVLNTAPLSLAGANPDHAPGPGRS
jgi:predicted nucleotidyltransferase